MLSGRLFTSNFKNVLGDTKSFIKLLSVIEAYTLLSCITGVNGAVLERTICSFIISCDLVNQASPEFGNSNKLLKLFSNCSNLFSMYKNEGIRTVVVVSSVSAISTVISDALLTRLWFMAVKIFTAFS